MQKIIQWKPIHSLKNHFYCDAIHDDYEGFRIILRAEKNDGPVIKILFDNVLFYQNTDEGNILNPPASDGDFSFPHPFYKIANSKLLGHFHQLSNNIYLNEDITHFAIYTCNDCIDILCSGEPNTEILGE